MNNYPPPPPPGQGNPGPPPPPSGYGGPPPPPPPPGYGGPPPGYGGQGYGGQVPPGAPPPKKRGYLPWLLGCGGCGALIAIALVVFGAIGYLGSRDGAQTRRAGSDVTPVSAADEEGTTLYTSDEAGLNDELRPHWLPFSFRYPEGWTVTERGDSAGGKNFVKVEKSDNGFTAENLAVGYMYAPPGRESDPELIAQLLGQFEQQFAAQFPGFRRVGDDRMEIGGRQATGFRFTSTAQTAERGAVQVFGRVLVVPVGDGKGLSMIMLGTPVGSGLRSVDDLGVKGGLPVILRTFRIGGSDASDGPGDDASGTETAGKPTEKPTAESDEEAGLQEIRPVPEDSTF